MYTLLKQRSIQIIAKNQVISCSWRRWHHEIRVFTLQMIKNSILMIYYNFGTRFSIFFSTIRTQICFVEYCCKVPVLLNLLYLYSTVPVLNMSRCCFKRPEVIRNIHEKYSNIIDLRFQTYITISSWHCTYSPI